MAEGAVTEGAGAAAFFVGAGAAPLEATAVGKGDQVGAEGLAAEGIGAGLVRVGTLGVVAGGVGVAAATASNFGATPASAGGVCGVLAPGAAATMAGAGFAVSSVSICGVAPSEGSLPEASATAVSAGFFDHGFHAQRDPPPRDWHPELTATRASATAPATHRFDPRTVFMTERGFSFWLDGGEPQVIGRSSALGFVGWRGKANPRQRGQIFWSSARAEVR
jgi:hypothetical protein